MHIFEEDQSYRNVDLVCPISHEIMREPVLAVDGHSYERSNLEKWFATKRLHSNPITSPVTNKEMPSDNIIPNHSLKKVIDGIIDKINGDQEKMMQSVRLQNREDESAILTEIDSRVQRWLDAMLAGDADSIDEAWKLVAEIGSLHIKLAASVQNRA